MVVRPAPLGPLVLHPKLLHEVVLAVDAAEEAACLRQPVLFKLVRAAMAHRLLPHHLACAARNHTLAYDCVASFGGQSWWQVQVPHILISPTASLI